MIRKHLTAPGIVLAVFTQLTAPAFAQSAGGLDEVFVNATCQGYNTVDVLQRASLQAIPTRLTTA